MKDRLRTYEKPPGLRIVSPQEGASLAPVSLGKDEEVAKPATSRSGAPQGPREEICIYCANRQREVCLGHCRPTADYSGFAVSPRERGEEIPRLPPMRELLTWPAAARLAIMHLVIDCLIEQVDGQ